MKFNSQKQKIKYVENLQIENKNLIIEQQSKNILINEEFDKNNKTSSFNQIIREIETEWEEMDFSGAFEEIPDYLVDQVYGWEIEIGEVPENYIPFIRVEILYRNVTNTGDKTIHSNVNFGYYKLIEELPNKRKKVTIYGSFYSLSGTPGVPVNNRFEGKLKIQILNPLYY